MKILHKISDKTLFELETDNMKDCLHAAIKANTNLVGANLAGVDLREADLLGADLRDADLVDTNLGGANLGGANLGGANLEDAYLGGAYLAGADLGGTNLRGADLGDAYLEHAKNILSFGPCIDGWLFYAVPLKGDLMIMAGCRWFSLEEARKHWQETRAGTDIGLQRLRILDFLETEAKMLGWLNKEPVKEVTV